MAERRVVVTGIGAISPLGLGYDAFTDGLFAGSSGIRPISNFDASRIPVSVAGEATAYSDELLPSDPRHHVVLSRPMQLSLVAAAECVSAAGLDEWPEIRARAACLIAVSRWEINLKDFGESFARSIEANTEHESGYSFSRRLYLSRGYRASHPLWLLKFIPNLAAAHVVRTFGLAGEANTYTAEASSGIEMLGHAAEAIREGVYDLALCGAGDSRVLPVAMARFLPLGLLAEGSADETDLSRPFDRARRGFVVGEGAVFFAVEELSHALERGVRPLAELVGWGQGSDAHHPYRAHPEGRGLRLAMGTALSVAGVDPSNVDVVSAAAASMQDLDEAEAHAMRETFGSHEPLVTAPAGAIGRTQMASGAFATAAAICALEHQSVPPTANTDHPFDGAPKGLVIGREARPASLRHALVDAWSFGGQAASLVVRRFEE